MAFHCTQHPSVLKEPDAACLSCVRNPLRSEPAFQTRGSADVMRGFFFFFFNGVSRIVCSLHSALPMVITGVRVLTLSAQQPSHTARDPETCRTKYAPLGIHQGLVEMEAPGRSDLFGGRLMMTVRFSTESSLSLGPSIPSLPVKRFWTLYNLPCLPMSRTPMDRGRPDLLTAVFGPQHLKWLQTSE